MNEFTNEEKLALFDRVYAENQELRVNIYKVGLAQEKIVAELTTLEKKVSDQANTLSPLGWLVSDDGNPYKDAGKKELLDVLDLSRTLESVRDRDGAFGFKDFVKDWMGERAGVSQEEAWVNSGLSLETFIEHFDIQITSLCLEDSDIDLDTGRVNRIATCTNSIFN
ncbi:hypothetical protein N9112_00185 [bacterium]|nr:hypothetical protein [bacterium]